MDANTDKNEVLFGWCDKSTRLLLDKYEQYLPLIGPMKQFKNKKLMWIQISNDILTQLNIERSAVQCENRYKTILKRKMQSGKSNQQSGAKRTRVEFEEELNKIKAIDDSLEPEILQGPGKIIEKNKENIPKDCTGKKKKKMTVSETLLQIQKEKEEKREKRHNERLEVLRDFIKIFSTDNTTDNNSE
ncbi:hypothetical protein ALC60_04657 [Trachymyrmex zeteki]|uniref:Myb/SANT-like DNA-binding domain-containing protein n=2 Tax=Mycetomoellerius zeteki TaxID=64791 RepID=A0A151X7R5_9HYME|nr:PREDICTED: uncharacterized protein LOC108721837 [Trachymyrmex zeteki]KYQ56417.1 hypothetical protein ALC60_04657 [Trachymyrmex zeteki]